MKGILYGVGVGPGDPEMMTLKAVRTIQKCTVIAVPDSGGQEQLALQIAREYIKGQEILHCRLPMTRDTAVLEQCHRKTARDICAKLEQGQEVAFLTLGDPSVYATFSYIRRLVTEQGYQVRIIPGVTSFCAAAATLGLPLCEGDQPLHILPVSRKDLPELLELPGCKVLMKLGKNRDELLDLLKEKGMLERAAMVQRCTLPEETVVPDLVQYVPDSGYFSVIVVRGEEE